MQNSRHVSDEFATSSESNRPNKKPRSPGSVQCEFNFQTVNRCKYVHCRGNSKFSLGQLTVNVVVTCKYAAHAKTGLRDIFVLVFLHVETRRVYISPSTYQPDEAWMLEQAEAFMRHARKEKLPCEILMHDNDGKFSKPFLEKLASHKIKTQRTAIRSPNTVAFVERFVQTIKQECLDHFVVFGHQHMDVLCKEFQEHYHQERPHQGLENQTVQLNGAKSKRVKKTTAPSTIRLSDVRCKERLGGLLKSYSIKSAA